MTAPPTPLLAPGSPLDAPAHALLAELFEGERQLMAALPTDDPLDAKRLRRVMLTHGEMFAQPDAIRTTWSREAAAISACAEELAARRFTRVYLTGCGDSLAVMVAARLLLEHMHRVPCEPVHALDLAYYYDRHVGREALGVTLRCSGTTPRTVEAMLVARARGAVTLALGNTPGSALMARSDLALLVHAERKGWPTQSSTAALAVLCRLGVEIGRRRGVASADALGGALDDLPRMMAEILRDMDRPVAAIAAREAAQPIYLFAGGGPAYAAAVFGATKMKECSPDHAMAIPLEEFHHYPSLNPGAPLFVLAPCGPSVARARDTAEEGRRWRGRITAVVTEDEDALDAASDTVLRLPPSPEPLAAFTFTLPLQLFAYHVAMEKFRRAGADIPG